jgi:hypothetical protein
MTYEHREVRMVYRHVKAKDWPFLAAFDIQHPEKVHLWDPMRALG